MFVCFVCGITCMVYKLLFDAILTPLLFDRYLHWSIDVGNVTHSINVVNLTNRQHSNIKRKVKNMGFVADRSKAVRSLSP